MNFVPLLVLRPDSLPVRGREPGNLNKHEAVQPGFPN